jgi:hypothetical protein
MNSEFGQFRETRKCCWCQPEKADFGLPSGRYVLVLRNQGYDFTVAGEVSDPTQCLERTEAANGTFYSDCEKK